MNDCSWIGVLSKVEHLRTKKGTPVFRANIEVPASKQTNTFSVCIYGDTAEKARRIFEKDGDQCLVRGEIRVLKHTPPGSNEEIPAYAMIAESIDKISFDEGVVFNHCVFGGTLHPCSLMTTKEGKPVWRSKISVPRQDSSSVDEFDVTAYGDLASTIHNAVREGSRVILRGPVVSRKYTPRDSKIERDVYSMFVNQMTLLYNRPEPAVEPEDEEPSFVIDHSLLPV